MYKFPTIMVAIFYFIAFYGTLAFVAGESFNVTNGVQDYFKASQLQFLHTIEIAEMKIASVDASFASRLDVIHFEQHQMLHEIHQLNQSLTPLQALSLVRKHCIQKYSPKLVTRSNARSELKNCHDKAKLGIESLTEKAKASVNSAKSYVIGQFAQNVRTCSSSYVKNDTALELCYVANVELATRTVGNYLRSSQDYLEKSLYESSVISHHAARCTYQVTSEVLKSLGAFLKDIGNCQRDFIDEIHLKVNHNEGHNLKKDQSELDKIDLNENAIARDDENLISDEDKNIF